MCFVLTDCYGCDVQELDPLHECTASCGYIISPLFPTLYWTNVRYTWDIQVDNRKYISFQFLEIDVFEEQLAACNKDTVEMIDTDFNGDFVTLGK